MTNRHLASTDVTLKQQKDAFRRLNGHKMSILTYLCFCFASPKCFVIIQKYTFSTKKGQSEEQDQCSALKLSWISPAEKRKYQLNKIYAWKCFF